MRTSPACLTSTLGCCLVLTRRWTSCRSMIDKALKQPGGAPEAVKRIKNLDLFAVGYTAFMCAVDGSRQRLDHERTQVQHRSRLGLYGLRDSTVRNVRQGRRLAERLTRSADLVADQFEKASCGLRRTDRQARGFDWDDWQKDDEGLCAVVGSFVLIASRRQPRSSSLTSVTRTSMMTGPACTWSSLRGRIELDGRLEELAAVSPPCTNGDQAPPVGQASPRSYNTPKLAKMVPLIKRASRGSVSTSTRG